jgi:hypothetical protein
MNLRADIGGLEGITPSRLTPDKYFITSAEGTVLCLCISSTLWMTTDINIITVSRGSLKNQTFQTQDIDDIWKRGSVPLLP